ncbi:MAG: molybdopterin-dependent oxidoreductase [Candidatus Cloacimonetes bacterium]|nr:molybdopterin-dependent oxidoreductase [Candidatus Cloacimonadota bacterium]
MNFRLMLIFLLVSTLLSSIVLENNDQTYTLDKVGLENYTQIELTTQREKNDELLTDNWIGIKITDILDNYQIEEFETLSFISADNYLVRITKNDINDQQMILALNRNGKPLDDEHIRLVIPEMRDMFWIQEIATIRTESNIDIPFPHKVYFVESVISDLKIRKDLSPFVNVEGYTFSEIAAPIFPFLKDEVLVLGRDGVKHSLDYDKYLAEAVVVKNGDVYDLKSASMPAGMWIKDLAYIQIFDVAAIFLDRFNSLLEVKEFANWTKFPRSLTLVNDNTKTKLNSTDDINGNVWRNAKWLEW